MANPKSLCGEQNLGKRGILTFSPFLLTATMKQIGHYRKGYPHRRPTASVIQPKFFNKKEYTSSLPFMNHQNRCCLPPATAAPILSRSIKPPWTMSGFIRPTMWNWRRVGSASAVKLGRPSAWKTPAFPQGLQIFPRTSVAQCRLLQTLRAYNGG